MEFIILTKPISMRWQWKFCLAAWLSLWWQHSFTRRILAAPARALPIKKVRLHGSVTALCAASCGMRAASWGTALGLLMPVNDLHQNGLLSLSFYLVFLGPDSSFVHKIMMVINEGGPINPPKHTDRGLGIQQQVLPMEGNMSNSTLQIFKHVFA